MRVLCAFKRLANYLVVLVVIIAINVNIEPRIGDFQFIIPKFINMVESILAIGLLYLFRRNKLKTDRCCLITPKLYLPSQIEVRFGLWPSHWVSTLLMRLLKQVPSMFHVELFLRISI